MQNLLSKAMIFCVHRLRNDRYRPIGDIQAIEFFPVQPLQKERL